MKKYILFVITLLFLTACTDKNKVILYESNSKEPIIVTKSQVFDDNHYSIFKGCFVIESEEDITNINNGVFKGKETLTKITLPQSITHIGEEAFMECPNLLKINIPNKVTQIEARTFAYCAALDTIIIPEGVESIGQEAFFGCTSLKYVVIPKSVKRIDRKAFSGCKVLESVIIPEGVETIEDAVFEGCTNLKEIFVSSDISSLGLNIFDNTAFLKNYNKGALYIGKTLYKYVETSDTCNTLIVKSGTKRIAAKAFEGCVKIDTVIINDGMKIIGESAFSNCYNLKSVVIPKTVKTIGSYAFRGCSSLVNIEIPNDVKLLNNGILLNCKNLKKIIIPSNCISIKDSVFKGCVKLKDIEFNQNVKNIGKHSFADCANLETIVIPQNCTSIGESAFYNCISLRDVKLPDALKSINDSAFAYCKNLREMKLPSKVQSIGRGAFYGCPKHFNPELEIQTRVRNDNHSLVVSYPNETVPFYIYTDNYKILYENLKSDSLKALYYRGKEFTIQEHFYDYRGNNSYCDYSLTGEAIVVNNVFAIGKTLVYQETANISSESNSYFYFTTIDNPDVLTRVDGVKYDEIKKLYYAEQQRLPLGSLPGFSGKLRDKDYDAWEYYYDKGGILPTVVYKSYFDKNGHIKDMKNPIVCVGELEIPFLYLEKNESETLDKIISHIVEKDYDKIPRARRVSLFNFDYSNEIKDSRLIGNEYIFSARIYSIEYSDRKGSQYKFKAYDSRTVRDGYFIDPETYIYDPEEEKFYIEGYTNSDAFANISIPRRCLIKATYDGKCTFRDCVLIK